MERLMHETRETFMSLLVVSCLVAGIGGAVFYTLGPDGWLSGLPIWRRWRRWLR
jgi:hypothetical protein